MSELYPIEVEPHTHPYPAGFSANRLPHAFDKKCKCKKGVLVERRVFYCTEVKPFATFQCETCMRRLLIIPAPHTPLLVWSEDFPEPAAVDFSTWVTELIDEREMKRVRDEIRYTGKHIPGPPPIPLE